MSVFKHVYKWTLEDDFTIVIPNNLKLPDFENQWCKIESNVITVKRKYSWDGCSPKRKILGMTIGTWDGPINPETGKQWCYEASLIHDVLCQFGIGKRKTADAIFRYLLGDFILKDVYYYAVRSFSIIFFK
jgi:hypothetical protein